MGMFFAHAFVFERDPVRVMDDAVEDGLGVGGITDEIVLFLEGRLAGDDGGAKLLEQRPVEIEGMTVIHVPDDGLVPQIGVSQPRGQPLSLRSLASRPSCRPSPSVSRKTRAQQC